MIDQDAYSFADEFYVVDKTIEIVVRIADEPTTIRIEALCHPPSGKYHTRAYVQGFYSIQPTYPQTGGKFDRKPEDKDLWVAYNLPWTKSDSADAAITQAIGFLRERCD